MLILLFGAIASSQGKSTSNDSLPDLQAWLAKSMKKYGTYSQGVVEHRISKVQFSGCRMNFDLTGTAAASYEGGMRHITTSSITFDLSDLDSNRISERIAIDSDVRTLLVNAIDGKEVVSSRVNRYFAEPISTLERSVSITVRKRIATEMKTKLMSAIKACQQMPSSQPGK